MQDGDDGDTNRQPRSIGAAHVIALKHVAAGRGNGEIAELMGLSPVAVRDILAEICAEYGVTTRAELVELAGNRLEADA